MIKDVTYLPKEINKIIDSYIPFEEIVSIPIDFHLFHFLTITGTYFLLLEKKIVYIGASIKIGNRLKCHLFPPSLEFKGRITGINLIRFRSERDAFDVENELIKYFQPIYNKRKYYHFNCSLTLDVDLTKLIKRLEKKLLEKE